MNQEAFYTLIAQEEDGVLVRINRSQGHTQAEREALQEQADRHRGNAWVQTEWRTAQ